MAVFGFQLQYYVGNRVDVLALQRMSVAFERAGAEFASIGRYAFPHLVPLLEQEVAGQFDTEGRGPNRGKWPALWPTYAKWKQKHYPGRPMLVRTGALRRALTDGRSPMALRDYSAVQLNYGTQGVPYATFHQTGTETPGQETQMPSRPPFDFRPDFEKQVRAAALKGAREAVKQAGLDDFTTLTPGPGEDAR